jgi:hypothetical protein
MARLVLPALLGFCCAASTVGSSEQRAAARDYCGIGGGLAGLQLGHFLQQASRDYVVLEAGRLGGEFFRQFPRHRKLISINKRHTGRGGSALADEYNLRHDWHSLLSRLGPGDDDDDNDDKQQHGGALFNSLVRDRSGLYPSADSLAQYAERWAEYWKINVQAHSRVTAVRKAVQPQAGFELTVARQQQQQQQAASEEQESEEELLRCRWVVVATGLSRPHVPDLPGLEEHSLSYNEMPTASEFWENKTVAILGGGNAAFETWRAIMADAAYVHVHSPSALRMAWETHYVGHVRSVNADPIDNYLLKSQDVLHFPSPLGLSRDNTVVGLEPHPDDDAAAAASGSGGGGGGGGGRQRVCLKDINHDGMAARLASPAEQLLDGRGRARSEDHSLTYTERFRAVDRYCYDVVVRCTGFDWDPAILRWEGGDASEGGRRASKYPVLSAEWGFPSAPGAYAVGGLSHVRDKSRRSAGGFVHGFRYTARALFKWMEQKHHHVPWARARLPTAAAAAAPPPPDERGAEAAEEASGAGPAAAAAPPSRVVVSMRGSPLAVRLRDRMDTASGLYQMFGVVRPGTPSPHHRCCHHVRVMSHFTYPCDVPHTAGGRGAAPATRPAHRALRSRRRRGRGRG